MLNTTPSPTLENSVVNLDAPPQVDLIIQKRQSWSWSTLFLISTLTAVATILIGNLFISSLV